MALVPKDAYPAQTIGSDPDYPHGKARNISLPGAGDGTPLEAGWLNDVWGFLQALLDYAGITPSGDADSVAASDYLDALKLMFGVAGPAVSTDNGIPRFDGVDGYKVQDSALSISDAGLIEYVTPPTRTMLIPMSIGATYVPSTGSIIHGAGFTRIAANTGSIVLPIDIPSGCVLTQVRAKVQPGTARATLGDRMQMSVTRFAPTLGDLTRHSTTQLGSTVRDDGTGNVQLLTISGLSDTADRALARVHVGITAGADASTNWDEIDGVEVTFTDAGPRNH